MLHALQKRLMSRLPPETAYEIDPAEVEGGPSFLTVALGVQMVDVEYHQGEALILARILPKWRREPTESESYDDLGAIEQRIVEMLVVSGGP